MPLIRVSLREGRSPADIAAIGEGVHQAMIDTINVPKDDRFQIFTEHPAHGLIYDAEYLGIHRTDEIVIVEITLNLGRTLEQKRALYKSITEKLARNPGLRKEDVLINLVEVPKENWSFGGGEASYAK